MFVITLFFSFPFLQINAINAATEAACLVLSVDETVKNPKVMRTLSSEISTSLFISIFVDYYFCILPVIIAVFTTL